jgi:hypothetical protein
MHGHPCRLIAGASRATVEGERLRSVNDAPISRITAEDQCAGYATDGYVKDYAMKDAGVNHTRELPLKHMALTVLAVGILCGTASVALKSPTSMEAVGRRISTTGAALESATLKTIAYPDAAIDSDANALGAIVPNATLEYLLMHETQRHLVRASEALQNENYKEAATEMRKASSYMRLEAASATGEAREELHTTMAKLDELATAVK